jgi:hypothetical protein
MSDRIEARVYLQCHFPQTPVAEVARMVHERYCHRGTRVYMLCEQSAMLVIWSGLQLNDADPLARNAHKLLTDQVAQSIGEFLDLSKPIRGRYDPLTLAIPADRFNLSFWLCPGETRKQYLKTTQVRNPLQKEPVRCEVRFTNLVANNEDAIKAFFLEWQMEACSQGFGGEILMAPASEIQIISKRGILIFPVYEKVTFPWVELYLRLRRCRPSLKAEAVVFHRGCEVSKAASV